jgi:molybdopterin converting factor small subunit
MKIEVRFKCPEILDSLKNGDYEVPAGATVAELFRVCQEKNNTRVEEEHKKWLLILVNGKQAEWDTVLNSGGKVFFLRGVMGG